MTWLLCVWPASGVLLTRKSGGVCSDSCGQQFARWQQQHPAWSWHLLVHRVWPGIDSIQCIASRCLWRWEVGWRWSVESITVSIVSLDVGALRPVLFAMLPGLAPAAGQKELHDLLRTNHHEPHGMSKCGKHGTTWDLLAGTRVLRLNTIGCPEQGCGSLQFVLHTSLWCGRWCVWLRGCLSVGLARECLLVLYVMHWCLMGIPGVVVCYCLVEVAPKQGACRCISLDQMTAECGG